MSIDPSPAGINADSGQSLRADLGGVMVNHGDRSARIIIDDIGGRFARVPNHLWDLLVGGDADRRAWNQAAASGWTRQRRGKTAAKQSLLAIRIPMFNVDFIARNLTTSFDWVFAPPAVKFWATMMVGAALFVISQYREVLNTIGEMPNYFSVANGWVLGGVFVGTKVFHELGHAIACRRTGVRCGSIGLIFFCGIPCPYCDVTQLWRLSRARQRAAVMLAGMYVEGILATIATVVWALADDGPARLHAMNVMIVCSISTLLFNANPLMRYDGYYVLSDWAGSVNLRSEARGAFNSLLGRFSRNMSSVRKSRSWNRGEAGPNLNRRSVGLVIYYLASTVYRYFVLLTLAAAVFVFASSIGLKLVAAVSMFALVVLMIGRSFKSSTKNGRPLLSRKLAAFSFTALVLGVVLMTPLPRRTTVVGYVDAANAVEVFQGADGTVQSVSFNIGDQVVAGQELARVRDDRLAIEATRVSGQLRVASYRTRTARRQTLDDSHSPDSETSGQIQSLEAVESALQANLVSLDRDRSRLSTRAPVFGTILPALQAGSTGDVDPWRSSYNLDQRVGMRSDKGETWCRIGTDRRLCIILRVDPKYREGVVKGMVVRGHEMQSPTKVQTYRVVSISSASQYSGSSPSVDSPAMFEILCEPTIDVPDEMDFLSRIGGSCKAVLELPSRSLAADLIDFLRELLM